MEPGSGTQRPDPCPSGWRSIGILADRAPCRPTALGGAEKASDPGHPKHVLTIVAHENSWVKVVIDQGASSEHKLKAGEQLRLVAQTSFNLLIGNVGGVKMSLNNQPVTVPGKTR